MCEIVTVTDNVATADAHTKPDEKREPSTPLLVAVFAVIALAMTFPSLERLHSSLAGDSGDSLLNLWIVRQVQIGAPRGWHAFWDAPIFHPALDTLAYSETLIPVAMVHAVLRLFLGDVLALNVIYIGAWTLCGWATYRLARRFTTLWQAAFLAALLYTYSSARLAQVVHFQLVVGGALVPLVLLAALRALESPTIKRGVVLGGAFVLLALTASYYAAMMAVVTAVLVLGRLVHDRRDARRVFASVGVAAALILFAAGPIAFQYFRVQRDAHFQREFVPKTATHWSDFLAVDSRNYVETHLPVLASHSTPAARSGENRLFPGVIASVFGVMGIVVVTRRLRHRRATRATQELAWIGLAGIVVGVLSFGDWTTVHGHRIPLPLKYLRHVVPGFTGISATVRLALMVQLALVLFAAVGLDVALRKLTQPRNRTLLIAAAAAVFLIGAAQSIPFVRVPVHHDDGGFDTALQHLPRGVVLELPAKGAATGPAWAWVETPRQLLALRDGDPRVNGYSGYEPKNFSLDTAILDTFPTAPALAQLRTFGVRYVILRTRLPGPITPSSYNAIANENGVGVLTDATARAMIKDAPAGVIASTRTLPGGYLLTLR